MQHVEREHFAAYFFEEIGENRQQKIKENNKNFQQYFIHNT